MSQKHSFDDTSPVWWPDKPYQDLPCLPPRSDIETVAILKACIEARAKLAALKQASELIPNPKVLLTCLPLLEAQASSEIENIVTTADELFRHLDSEATASPGTREALRYREALMEGFRALTDRPLGVGVAQQVCSRIKAIEMSPRKMPGTAIGNPRTGEIVYTPPSGEEAIGNLLSNWEQFIHGRDGIDPLVRMAVAHYQFEAIHPFSDGNGRTGRIINSLFIVERGLLGFPILYLSRYIIRNKGDYYQRLLAVTKSGAWEPWILYMLAAVEETSDWTLAKIQSIRELITRTKEHVKKVRPKIYSSELVELLFERPYCRISNLVDGEIAGRQAASRYLKDLVSVGVLDEQQYGRDKLFVNTGLTSLLATDENIVP